MHSIYAKASTVMGWLGLEDEKTPSAFECIYSLTKMKGLSFEEVPWNSSNRELGKWSTVNSNFHSLKRLDRALWQSFTEFLERPWLERVWAFQEVAVSYTAKIVSGTHILDLDALHEACKVVGDWQVYSYDLRRSRCYSVLNIRDVRQSTMNAVKGPDAEKRCRAMYRRIFSRLLHEMRVLHAIDSETKSLLFSASW